MYLKVFSRRKLFFGSVFTGLFLLIQSCEPDYNEFVNSMADKVLNLEIEDKTLLADGKSRAKITVTLPSYSNIDSVRLVTSHGRFDCNTDSICYVKLFRRNDVLEGTVNIISGLNVVENVIVRSSIGDFYDLDSVDFITAFPDTMKIECISPFIKSGLESSIDLNVCLGRFIGFPSIGQKVNLEAFKKGTNTKIGDFRNLPLSGSDENGKITGIYDLRDSTYTGEVELVAHMSNMDTVLSDSYILLIIKQ